LRRCPLGCSLSAQLCSVSLAVICQLNSHVLAQLQSQAQPNCRLSVGCNSSNQVRLVSSAATFQLCLYIYQSSCILSAHLQFVCSLVSWHTVMLSSIFLILQSIWEAALLGPVPSAVMLML